MLFLLMQLDYGALTKEAIHIHWGHLVLSLVLILCQIFFLNLRWHYFLNAGKHEIPFKTSSLINIAGYFANIMFITSIGGIIAKSGLAVRHGLSLVQALFITFLDRFMTLFALIIFSALSLPFLKDILDFKISTLLSLSITAIILLVGGVLFTLRSGILKNYILSNRKRSRLLATMRLYMENYELMAKSIFYSLIAQACFILSVYALSFGIPYENQSHGIQAIEFLALIPVLALISSLPISFGGWGVREGAFIYGLGLIGYSMESAFLLSIQVGLITLIAPFIVGIPYILNADTSLFKFGTKAYSKKQKP